jgi:hypothetical protein
MKSQPSAVTAIIVMLGSFLIMFAATFLIIRHNAVAGLWFTGVVVFVLVVVLVARRARS